ncbi:MAG TPA: ABC transporter substrate binding protein [Vicinamibacterales bacterium]|nr:ABC transporter substrate binding protein [Vicinamibacterales bacterium]
MFDCRAWILLLMLLPLVSARSASAQAVPSRQVLVVYSHEREMAMYTGFDRAFRSQLQSGSGSPIEFYTEYLDLIRFGEPGYRQKSVDYLRLKYTAQRIDLIVTVSSLAFDFILEHGEAIFPGIPVVFASVNTSRIEEVALRENVTGVAVKRDLRDTLDLLLHVHPDTQQVFVPVGSSATEQSWAAATRALLEPYEKRVRITYLSGLPMESLLRVLTDLPRHSAVLFTTLFFSDGAGRYFLPEEALADITARSSAPVYSTDQAFLGSGIVGGVLFDLAPSGDAAGRLGKRVLAGERPASIAMEIIDPNVPMFDARQLQRWNISKTHLPVNSVIRFEEPGPWDQYKFYIIGAISLVVFQAALIAGLVAARVKRRRAEASLRASHVQVRDLAGRLITAQEEERARIARELHDDAGQRMAFLSIGLSRIKRRITDDPGQASGELTSLQQEMITLSKDLRALSHTLHPGLLEHLGLVKSLEIRCDEVTAESGVAVRLEVEREIGAIPAATALCLYRVAQEALHNIVKHAHAGSARVRLSRRNGHIAMQVDDDGRGFETGTAAGHRGLGLMSLDERVRMLDGTFTISTSRRAGTTLSVTLPVGDGDSTASTGDAARS